MTQLETVDVLTRIIHLQADIIKRQDEVLALCDVRTDEMDDLRRKAEALRRRIEE